MAYHGDGLPNGERTWPFSSTSTGMMAHHGDGLPNCERTWPFSLASSAPILSVLIPPLWKAMFGSLSEILSPAAWLTAAPNRCRRRRQRNKSVQRQN